MLILLTNDDGITAPGLRALYRALRQCSHEVASVAPMRQQSGVSHSLTVFEPLRTQEYDESDFHGIGVHGTPTDCVKLALARLMDRRPDIILSGINLGRNVGPDVFYSGTIGAAAEGAHAGIPSMAISHANYNGAEDMDAVAAHVVRLAEEVVAGNLLPGRVINVNYPHRPLADAKGPRVCPQSLSVFKNIYKQNEDPRGWPYWWLNGDWDMDLVTPDSDIDLLQRGYITITPLKYDYTDHERMHTLRHLEEKKTSV